MGENRERLKDLMLSVMATTATDPSSPLRPKAEEVRDYLEETGEALDPELDRWMALDQEYKFAHRQILLQKANSIGRHFVSESIIKEYRWLKSIPQTAEVTGTGYHTVRGLLKLAKEPLRGPGGSHKTPKLSRTQVLVAYVFYCTEAPHKIDPWCKAYVRREGLPCNYRHLKRRLMEEIEAQRAA